MAVWWLAAAAVAFLSSGVLSAQRADLDPRVQALVASVSEERLAVLLKRLESFGTRHTVSSAVSPTQGIGAARQWIFDQLRGYSPKLQVSFETFRLDVQDRIPHDVEARNVMALLPGRSERRVYISGHYDTITFPGGAQANASSGVRTGPLAPADPKAPNDLPSPGVNDDGSGTALTLELARVLSQSGLEFDATLVFMFHVAEEEGLLGAAFHAQKASAERVRIDAVLNNDIVGNDRSGNGTADGATVRVFSEGPEDSPSRELARFIERWGARYVPSHRVRLMARPDRFNRGGDHLAYNQSGFPAVVFRESRENLSRQHATTDTFEGVSLGYLAQNARVNAAAAAVLALAPMAPVVSSRQGPTLTRGPSGYDAHLTWTASPGAVAYRVVWRDAWGPDWQHEALVGNVTEFLLPGTLIDDHVFGVAAVDAQGHESVVAPYVSTPRAPIRVKTIP